MILLFLLFICTAVVTLGTFALIIGFVFEDIYYGKDGKLGSKNSHSVADIRTHYPGVRVPDIVHANWERQEIGPAGLVREDSKADEHERGCDDGGA